MGDRNISLALLAKTYCEHTHAQAQSARMQRCTKTDTGAHPHASTHTEADSEFGVDRMRRHADLPENPHTSSAASHRAASFQERHAIFMLQSLACVHQAKMEENTQTAQKCRVTEVICTVSVRKK